MTRNAILLVFIPLLHAVIASDEVCNTVCRCIIDSAGTSTDCSQAKINIIPPVDMWPANASTLDLSWNYITYIDVEMAHDSLQELRLSNNKITFINESVFGGLNKLTHLDLSHNFIDKIEAKTFYGLLDLASLDVSNNNIKSLNEFSFALLFRMENLTLSHNRITRFNRKHLNRMSQLQRLSLSDTDLYSLEPMLFHDFDHLQDLDLSKNEFNKVPTEAIRSAKNLNRLCLNENPIDKLDKNSFLGLGNLEVLELNFMAKLEMIEAETFTPLTKLVILEIKSSKRLHTIHPDAFKGLFPNSALRELQLEGNQLMSFAEIPCKRLSKFNLLRNPWNCDCRLKWLRSCPILEIYASDLRCDKPSRLFKSQIVTIAEEDFSCETMRGEIAEEIHHNRVMRTMSLALGCAFLVILGMLIALVLKWRSIRGWWRNRNKGHGAVYYVRARSNPTQPI